MNWNLSIADPAQKELKRLPASDRARITDALQQMQRDPFTGDITRLTNLRFGWRRRVGNYRILYDLNPTARTIRVHHILRRTSTTYR